MYYEKGNESIKKMESVLKNLCKEYRLTDIRTRDKDIVLETEFNEFGKKVVTKSMNKRVKDLSYELFLKNDILFSSLLHISLLLCLFKKMNFIKAKLFIRPSNVLLTNLLIVPSPPSSITFSYCCFCFSIYLLQIVYIVISFMSNTKVTSCGMITFMK